MKKYKVKNPTHFLTADVEYYGGEEVEFISKHGIKKVVIELFYKTQFGSEIAFYHKKDTFNDCFELIEDKPVEYLYQPQYYWNNWYSSQFKFESESLAHDFIAKCYKRNYFVIKTLDNSEYFVSPDKVKCVRIEKIIK